MADNAPTWGQVRHTGPALCHTAQGMQPVLAVIAFDSH